MEAFEDETFNEFDGQLTAMNLLNTDHLGICRTGRRMNWYGKVVEVRFNPDDTFALFDPDSVTMQKQAAGQPGSLAIVQNIWAPFRSFPTPHIVLNAPYSFVSLIYLTLRPWNAPLCGCFYPVHMLRSRSTGELLGRLDIDLCEGAVLSNRQMCTSDELHDASQDYGLPTFSGEEIAKLRLASSILSQRTRLCHRLATKDPRQTDQFLIGQATYSINDPFIASLVIQQYCEMHKRWLFVRTFEDIPRPSLAWTGPTPESIPLPSPAWKGPVVVSLKLAKLRQRPVHVRLSGHDDMAVSDNGLDEISDMDSAEEAWLDLEATPGPGEECDPQWAHEGQDEARQVVRADFPVRAAPDCPSPSQQLACVALEEDHAYNDTVWEQSCYGETESSHTCQSVDADDVMLFNERHWHLQRIFKTKLENLTPQEKGNAVIITVFGVSWDLYDLDDQSVLALAGTNRWLRRRFQLADPLRLFDISLSFPVDDNLTLSTQKVRKLSRLVESLQTGWLDDRGILFRFVVTLSFEPIKSHPDGVPGQPYHEWLSAVVDLLTGLPLRPAHVKVRDSLCDKFVEAVRDRGFAVLDGRDTLQVIRSTLTVLYDDRDRTHTWVSRQAVLARMDAYPELTELFTSLVNWKLHGIEEEV